MRDMTPVASRNVKRCKLWKIVWQFFKKLKLQYDLADHGTSGYIPKKKWTGLEQLFLQPSYK